jgi:hypothetical protein
MRQTLALLALAFVLVSAPLHSARAQAQTCTPADIARAVDEGARSLQKLNEANVPALNARLLDLQKKKGWADHDLEDKAFAFLEDDTIRAFDRETNTLVTRLESLSDDAAAGAACERLVELRQTFERMREIATEKHRHMLGRLDRELEPSAAAGQIAAAKPPAREAAPPVAAPAPPKAAGPPTSAPWSVTTTPAEGPPAPEPAPASLPPPAEHAHPTYTLEEIRHAGRGFFGKISTGLASVIDFAFQKAGRPTGYILGDEGGGAFLAGVRYGKGLLHLKGAEPVVVYWRGPSIGYDFGAAGSRLMVLVYGVGAPEEMHANFAGIDGSAYLVGGVGITFLTNGKKVMAPIRSGLGLRLGANVGYLKFSPNASWLPF